MENVSLAPALRLCRHEGAIALGLSSDLGIIWCPHCGAFLGPKDLVQAMASKMANATGEKVEVFEVKKSSLSQVTHMIRPTHKLPVTILPVGKGEA